MAKIMNLSKKEQELITRDYFCSRVINDSFARTGLYMDIKRHLPYFEFREAEKYTYRARKAFVINALEAKDILDNVPRWRILKKMDCFHAKKNKTFANSFKRYDYLLNFFKDELKMLSFEKYWVIENDEVKLKKANL